MGRKSKREQTPGTVDRGGGRMSRHQLHDVLWLSRAGIRTIDRFVKQTRLLSEICCNQQVAKLLTVYGTHLPKLLDENVGLRCKLSK